MVARDVNDLSPQCLSGLIHEFRQVLVAVGLAGVGEITGEYQHVRGQPGRSEVREARHQVVAGACAGKQLPCGREMDIRDLDEEIVRHWELPRRSPGTAHRVIPIHVR